ncbi:AMP-binding protein [Micromonospora lutea]|uniref:Amino acid adenylation protein n=1 Tax=Micromonospora lutea TaxID=419825 RepID=A0ABQ4ITS9_9ACTN|nr:AMP-binding protein [Micromonospora lutea]GIJ21048.1 amino acid adenylation protein [Micromonospora lutea]
MTTLGEMVARTVRDHPDQPALDLGGTVLTYRELWDLAGRIAVGLVAAGHAGSPVGLCASRTSLAYAGYLAALRCGAPVVPLHPTYPADRTALMVTAAGSDTVLLDDTVLDPVEDRLRGQGTRTLRPSSAVGQPVTDRFAAPDAVAYILFTSGSTGVPKGVPISHRSAHAYIRHNIARYEVGPGDRLSQTFDLTFDPSVFDLFVAWGAGATLVVPTGNELVSPARYVRDRAITHWFSVPSVISLAHGMRGLSADAMPGLRWSLFIGEQFTYDQARLWRLAAPASTIDNVYGPTELTVACTEYRLPADPADWPATSNGTVPIGQVYPFLDHVLLDDDGAPTDDGELCVRGVQRFPGYLDPRRDAGAFTSYDGTSAVPYDGATPLTARHWYRTGDRVRHESGTLVHLGRMDRQVKLNGCRIELGEIEFALRRHASVEEAVALVSPDKRTLCAFYTGTRCNARELRQALREQLPPFMIPRRIEWLERLPLNSNGKIDRRVLADALVS